MFFTTSPNGTITHWLNNCKAKISSQVTELTVPNLSVSGVPRLDEVKRGIRSSQCFDAEEAALTLMRLQGPPVLPPSAPEGHGQRWGAGRLPPCTGSKSQPTDGLFKSGAEHTEPEFWKARLKASHAVSYRTVNLSAAGKGKGWSWTLLNPWHEQAQMFEPC